MKHLIYTTVCYLIMSLTVNAQSGTADNSFGINGKVINETFTGICDALVIQEDGKILTGGTHYSYNVNERGFIIGRFNTDGSLDESFGNKGETTITYAEGESIYLLVSLALQENGKIIAGGMSTNTSNHYSDLCIARLNANGSLDSSFNGDGIFVKSVGKNDRVADIVIQEDDKIIVTGFKGLTDYNEGEPFVMRILPDGEMDESFGEKGIVLVSDELGIYSVNAIALQTDNKILIAGKYFGNTFFVIRFLPDGSFDNTFDEEKDGIAGIRFEDADLPYSYIYDMALQPDGKILLAGGGGSGPGKMAVVRFNNDGSIDTAFGDKKGYSLLTTNKVGSTGALTVNVEADKKIILTGVYSTDEKDAFAAAKYNVDGSVDLSFGENGLATQDFNEFTNILGAGAGALQKDGKIVVGGYGYPPTDNDFTFIGLVRFNNDAALPIIYSKFTATQTKEYVTLNWQTTTELNNSYFAVERSGNAVNYTAVARVNSAATGAAVQDYAYTDKLPFAGTNYYRLKQVDKDGKFSYSKTVSIGYLKPGSIQLFPNPAKDKLTVKGLNTAITSTITVLDVQGKTLQQFTVKAATYTFSIQNLAPGTYMVRVKDANGVATEKFVKQ